MKQVNDRQEMTVRKVRTNLLLLVVSTIFQVHLITIASVATAPV
jgi:hypothetical protein